MRVIGVLVLVALGWPGVAAAAQERAIFAGGCFWCMEAELEATPGVVSVVSGYTGGSVKNPSYAQVGTGKTGHAEAVEVLYDAEKVSYGQLLDVYWSNIDPTDAGGQFADRGSQYRTEIFVLNEEQRKLAEESLKKREAKLKQKIATRITAASEFYPAEAYHQDYAKQNSVHYTAYKYGSGRVKRLKELNKE